MYHSNKSIEDRDNCKYLYIRSCGAINEDYKKALDNKSWILANLLDSASLSMRCHDLYYAKASLKFIEENKSLFQKETFDKKEKKMLQNKWYRTLHYCWMLEEWKDIKYLEERGVILTEVNGTSICIFTLVFSNIFISFILK